MECGDDGGVEVCAGAVDDDFARFAVVETLFVWTFRSQRIVTPS